MNKIDCHVILASQNKELLDNIFDILSKSGKVIRGKKEEKIFNFRVDTYPSRSGYFYMIADCTMEMYDWMNGFSTGYLKATNYLNS